MSPASSAAVPFAFQRDPSDTAPASARRLRIALGTWLAIEARAASEAQALAGIEAACRAVAEVERWMHPYRTGSDLERINLAQPGEPVPLQPATCHVLAFARRLNELTAGIFDPCLPGRPGRITDIELACGEARSQGTEPDAAERHGGGCAVICHAPVMLDLGGIAKGYALDRAAEALRHEGCSSGLVNAGGDLRLLGAKRERIVLRDTAGRHRTLWLEDRALAVSDLEAHARPPQHQGYYLRSGAPVAGRHYAAVIARDAMTADALTKCVLLGRQASVLPVLRELGAATVE